AQQVFARLQGLPAGDPTLVDDFNHLWQQIEANTMDRQERSTTDLFREIWSERYRSRLLLSLAFQTFAQWSGGNGITYYVPQVRPSSFLGCRAALTDAPFQIFQYAGVTGD